MLVYIWRIQIERDVYRVRNSNFSKWAFGTIETRVRNKMLLSDKFYRSFVLVPCEICVVPFGHRKIAADWNDISLAKMKSTVVGLTHACASLCSFKHGYLSLQKYSLFGRIFGESSTFSISHVAKLVTNRVSLLNRNAGKPAFRHASPQTHLRVALLLQMRWLGSQARCWS